jgi:hypothetical protein
MLVLVDNLEAPFPQLESIWLVLYLPTDSEITLMPIYPSSVQASYRLDEQVQATFQVISESQGLLLSQDFLTALHNLGFWWSGYVMVDGQALNQLIHTITTPGQQVESSREQHDLLTNKQDLLKAQVKTFKMVCEYASNAPRELEESLSINIQDTMEANIIVDFDKQQLVDEIHLILGHGSNLRCEVPVFDLQPYASR